MFAPNSEFITRIKEVMQESVKEKEQKNQQNEGDKEQDIAKKRDAKEVDNLIERIRSRYQNMIEENKKRIENINQEISKIKDKKNKNETFDYEKSRSKELFKYNIRDFWDTVTRPIKDVVGDLYQDIKKSTPIARLLEFMFKSSLKLAKFIDKRFGIGLLDTSRSGFWAKLRNKINERKQKRKLEQLERLKTYYEKNFGDIAEKEIKKDISEGLYKKDYNSLDEDKKQKVDSIYQSIINARLEQAAILEKVINEDIENEKKINTSYVIDHQDKKEEKEEQKDNKKKNIISKLKSRINEFKEKTREKFKEVKDTARKLTQKVNIFKKRKSREDKKVNRQQEEIQPVCLSDIGQNRQEKQDLKSKYEALKDKIASRVKNTFDKVKNIFSRKKKKENIVNQETNNTVIQESCDPSNVVEKLEEVSERDKKSRFKLRKITRDLRKRFNIKRVFKRFKLKRPEFVKRGISRLRGLGRIGYKLPRLRLPKPNLNTPFRSIGRFIYGKKTANVSRVASRGLARGLGAMSSRLGTAGRTIGGRILGGARALGGLRTVGNLLSAGRIIPALGGLLSNPVGWVILAIVAIVAMVAVTYYIMYMFKKMIALFKPTIEYSAAKAIEEYKEMQALSKIENKEDLRSKLSNIGKTPVTAETLEKTSTFATLAAGNLEDEQYLVKANNNTNAQMRRPDTPSDYDMSQVGGKKEKRKFKQPWETTTEEKEEIEERKEDETNKRKKQTKEGEDMQEENESETDEKDIIKSEPSVGESAETDKGTSVKDKQGIDVNAAVSGATVELQKYTASVIHLSNRTVTDRAKIKKEKNKRRKKQQDMEI
ncbi:MAG: hypothetical protein QXN68_01145 [Thermoplasmata archaeon]